ncbi:MAG: CAP domain-containing protein [bacterium]|nr:CAP domain-containing protein [bacterium]
MGSVRVARRSVVPAVRIVLAAALATLYVSTALAAPSSAARDWLTRCFFSLPPLDSATEVYASVSAQDYAADVFDQTNAIRARKKLSQLKRDPHLDAVAQAHALDMAALGYFDHHSPQGMDVFDRMECAGCPGWWTGGENIAAGYRTPQIAIDEWMDSPGHKRNILDGNYEHMGIGVYHAPDSEYGWYWVQVFASYEGDGEGRWLEPGQSL